MGSERDDRRGWQDETVGWPHQLDGYEFEQALGVGDEQGSLACYSPWGRKELDTTEWLNWTELKVTADDDCSHESKWHLHLGRKAMTNLDSILKSRDITLLTKVHLVKLWISSSHVWMWQLDHKESWVGKNWCFWTVVLEMTLESPLDC